MKNLLMYLRNNKIVQFIIGIVSLPFVIFYVIFEPAFDAGVRIGKIILGVNK